MSEEEKAPEVKKEEEKSYELVKVPTEYGLTILTPEGNQLTNEQALVLLLNKVDQIKKVLG